MTKTGGIEKATFPLFTIDTTGRFVFINDAALKLIGSPSREISQQFNAFKLPSFKAIGLDAKLENCVKGQPFEYDCDYVSMFGKRSRVHLQGLPLPIPVGGEDVAGAAVLIHEMEGPHTSRKSTDKLRSERDIAQKELHEINGLHQRFIAMVSHELRTPILPVIGYLSMLQKEEIGPLTEKQKKAVSIATRSTRRLLDLVEKILVMSRGKEEQQSSDFGEVDIPSTVGEAIETMLPVLSQKQLQVITDCPRSVARAWGVRHKILQVLLTLLDNAQKFAEPGGRILVKARDLGPRKVAVTVANTGLGIPKEDRHRVFELFYQVEPPETRSHDGMGLGLAIAREIVMAHGGSIEVVDIDDFDTGVQISLRRADATHRTDSWIGSTDEMRFRVLLADPDETRRRQVADIVSKLPFDVRQVETISDARRLITQWPPTALIVSLDQPYTASQALDLIKNIREKGPRKLLPIITLSTNPSPEQKRQALDCGVTAIVDGLKDWETLIRILGSIYPAHF